MDFQQVLNERDVRRRVYGCRKGVATNRAALQIAVSNQAWAGLLLLFHASKFTPISSWVFAGSSAAETTAGLLKLNVLPRRQAVVERTIMLLYFVELLKDGNNIELLLRLWPLLSSAGIDHGSSGYLGHFFQQR